jgi:hypothetical protein
VTCDDCIAIKADEVVVLRVHRRSATPLLAVDVQARLPGRCSESPPPRSRAARPRASGRQVWKARRPPSSQQK